MPNTQLTLLAMVQQATGELGIPVPQAVASASDPGTVQLFQLMKRELQELQQSKDDGWSVLQTLAVIEVAAALTTTCNTTVGSGSLTSVADTTGLAANLWIATGDNFPQSARITAVSGSTVTLDMECSATQTGADVVFYKDTYTIPSDFDFYVGNTWWDRTNRWQLLGPDSPQIDQYHRSGIVQTGPRLHWRQIGPYYANWRLWPQPSATSTAPQQLVFEYVSSKCVMLAGSTTNLGTTFTGDTDVPLLDSNALILGLKWRYLQAKRLQYADFQAEYLDFVDRLKARDGGSPVLSMAPNVGADYLISPASVPDGNYPS